MCLLTDHRLILSMPWTSVATRAPLPQTNDKIQVEEIQIVAFECTISSAAFRMQVITIQYEHNICRIMVYFATDDTLSTIVLEIYHRQTSQWNHSARSNEQLICPSSTSSLDHYVSNKCVSEKMMLTTKKTIPNQRITQNHWLPFNPFSYRTAATLVQAELLRDEYMR